MPLPTSNQVHINRPLTNISIAYRQRAEGYVSWRVFPTVPVVKQSDSYFELDRSDFLRDMAQPRGSSQESAGSGYNVSNTTYNCRVHAFHKDVDDQVRANTDNPLNADRNATQFVTQVLLTKMEQRWVDTYFKTGVWGTDKTGTTDFVKWSDVTSTPIKDVKAGVKTVLQNTGFKPNKFVIGYEVMDELSEHPTVIDRIKYTTQDVVTPQLLARLFGIEEVLVAEAIKNSAVAGATASYAFIHADKGLLCYANPQPAIEMPSAGYMFEWSGISQGLGLTQSVSRIPMPWLGRGNVRIEGEIAFDPKVTAAALGYFFDDIV